MTKVDPNTLFTTIGKLVLYALPVLGVLGVIVTLGLGLNNLFILSLYAVVPMIIAPVVFYKYYSMQAQKVNLSDRLFKFLIICFMAIFAESIILLNTSDVRTYWYYIAIAAAALFILLQIVLFEVKFKKQAAVFFEIILLNLNLIWGVTLKYNYFVGRTDTLAHAWFIQNLLQAGHITDVFGLYTAFPLWHILVAGAYMITGTSIPTYTMMFIVSGIIYAVTPLVIFLTVSKLVNSQKMGLIAALLISVQTFFIFDGMYSIARGAVTIIMLAVILLLLSSNNSRYKFGMALLGILAIILYHTVSIVFVLLILFVLYVLQKIFVKEKAQMFISLKFLVASVAMTVVYWELFATGLTQELYNDIVVPAPAGLVTTSIITAPYNELANYLQYTPLLFFILVGIIYILKAKDFNSRAKIFGIASLLFLPIVFPGPALLFNKLSMDLNIDRFHDYAFLFTTMLAAVGFAGLFYKAGKYAKTCLIVIFAVMIVLSITNDFVASDNPLVKRPFFTYYLTEGEVSGIGHLSNMTAPTGYVMGDYVIKRYMEFSPYANTSQLLEIGNDTLLRNSGDDIAMIREGELAKRPLMVYQPNNATFVLSPSYDKGNELGYYYDTGPAWNVLNKSDLVYNSNDVSGYQ